MARFGSWAGGLLGMSVALAVSCATAKAQEVRVAAIREYVVSRDASPWRGYTSSYQEEQAGYRIAAAPIAPAMERVPHLGSYVLDGEPFLAIDRERRRVLLNERFFGPFSRPDAPRLAAGERVEAGTVKDRRLLDDPLALFSFLIESEIVRTYWHLEARIELLAIRQTGPLVEGSFSGSHLYFTDRRNEEEYAFRLELDTRTGALAVVGGLSP